MKRVQGSSGVRLIECVNPVQDKWRVRWDVQTTGGETSYMEEEFSGKPSIETVKALIFGWINGRVEDRILSGFTYLGKPVWLSRENQFNYKACYDLAVQTKGSNLPIEFKFGTDGLPYHATFNTLDELTDFYTKFVNFIMQTVATGWKEKDSIDFTLYI